MTRAEVAGTGRVARWLLLACTLFGLAAMHTLGHAGTHAAGEHSAGGHVTVGTLAMQAMAVGAAKGEGCAGGCTHLGPLSSGDGGMAGWSVCLAVLSGFAVLVLLAALWWAAVMRRRMSGLQGGRRVAGARAPPVRFGLVLAAMSVLRL
ncbi:DUF6153 family protein [Actinoplanes sp. NPDC051475]|uniref:DUF6153 family protein n=1 Tax=Actinoplanes sp. NPDC051475 TaxID=3157225 RepID=UPI00344F864F